MKLRFSMGIIFSFTLHFFLILGLIGWYPVIIKNGVWEWGNWDQFSNKKNKKFNFFDKSEKKFYERLSASEVIFPDIVLFEKNEKIKIKKKNIPSKESIKSILTQVEKFPQSLNLDENSNKKLSVKVGELLTILVPTISKNSTSKGEGRLNLNFNELKEFRKSLEDFLSKRWEVPMHLRESNYSAFVRFEINKNGRLLNWEIKQSSNVILEKTLKKLLKNLQFLPSLPKSYLDESYKFGIKFTPLNLN